MGNHSAQAIKASTAVLALGCVAYAIHRRRKPAGRRRSTSALSAEVLSQLQQHGRGLGGYSPSEPEFVRMVFTALVTDLEQGFEAQLKTEPFEEVVRDTLKGSLEGAEDDLMLKMVLKDKQNGVGLEESCVKEVIKELRRAVLGGQREAPTTAKKARQRLKDNFNHAKSHNHGLRKMADFLEKYDDVLGKLAAVSDMIKEEAEAKAKEEAKLVEFEKGPRVAQVRRTSLLVNRFLEEKRRGAPILVLGLTECMALCDILGNNFFWFSQHPHWTPAMNRRLIVCIMYQVLTESQDAIVILPATYEDLVSSMTGPVRLGRVLLEEITMLLQMDVLGIITMHHLAEHSTNKYNIYRIQKSKVAEKTAWWANGEIGWLAPWSFFSNAPNQTLLVKRSLSGVKSDREMSEVVVNDPRTGEVYTVPIVPALVAGFGYKSERYEALIRELVKYATEDPLFIKRRAAFGVPDFVAFQCHPSIYESCLEQTRLLQKQTIADQLDSRGINIQQVWTSASLNLIVMLHRTADWEVHRSMKSVQAFIKWRDECQLEYFDWSKSTSDYFNWESKGPKTILWFGPIPEGLDDSTEETKHPDVYDARVEILSQVLGLKGDMTELQGLRQAANDIFASSKCGSLKPYPMLLERGISRAIVGRVKMLDKVARFGTKWFEK